MKFSAAILSVIFLLFSIQPVIVQSHSSGKTESTEKMTCCKKMANNKCEKNKNDRQDNSCNGCDAFMYCPLCCSYLPASDISSPSLAALKIINKKFVNFFVLSTYQPDCFHPPESASV